MWYINSEGDAFNLVDAQSIVKSDTDSRIFAMYFVGEDSLEIESIDNRKIAKQFISWLVGSMAADMAFCCYTEFEDINKGEK